MRQIQHTSKCQICNNYLQTDYLKWTQTRTSKACIDRNRGRQQQPILVDHNFSKCWKARAKVHDMTYQDNIFPLLKLQPKLLHCSRGRSCRETVGLSTIEIDLSVSGAAVTVTGELWSPGRWQGTSRERQHRHSRSGPRAEGDAFTCESELLLNSRTT